MINKAQLNYLSLTDASTIINVDSNGNKSVSSDDFESKLLNPELERYKESINELISNRIDEKINDEVDKSSKLRYQLKLIYALSNPDSQYIKTEAELRGLTPQEQAKSIVNASEKDVEKIKSLENARVELKLELQKAKTIDDVYKLYQQASLYIETI